MPSNNMLTILRREELIQPIDPSRLDRWSLQKPIAESEPWRSFLKDEEKYYGVPFTRGYYTNYVRGKMVDDGSIPSDLVNSWNIYFEDMMPILELKIRDAEM